MTSTGEGVTFWILAVIAVLAAYESENTSGLSTRSTRARSYVPRTSSTAPTA